MSSIHEWVWDHSLSPLPLTCACSSSRVLTYYLMPKAFLFFPKDLFCFQSTASPVFCFLHNAGTFVYDIDTDEIKVMLQSNILLYLLVLLVYGSRYYLVCF